MDDATLTLEARPAPFALSLQPLNPGASLRDLAYAKLR
ncbi:hypothetical protein LMG29542_00330 [Paraburkholderia humisilvae]|uniref:Uncharacterized protein n=1 Tax=Paraburkholderia humisilvae TaxID=627669 RepID=A0A6J5CXK2_9BURK|nr:hypothetical protein LMG29542_00330 [Paraburkholderia humisilvae]